MLAAKTAVVAARCSVSATSGVCVIAAVIFVVLIIVGAACVASVLSEEHPTELPT